MVSWPAHGTETWDEELRDYVDANGFVSTDASFGLSTPTGDGGEFVITADVLVEIRYNGNTVWTP